MLIYVEVLLKEICMNTFCIWLLLIDNSVDEPFSLLP